MKPKAEDSKYPTISLQPLLCMVCAYMLHIPPWERKKYLIVFLLQHMLQREGKGEQELGEEIKFSCLWSYCLK